jgi:ribosome-associated toxin RatA of RatAB toxin-antitoxin module
MPLRIANVDTLVGVAHQTESSIEIRATTAQVMAVVADLENYPLWIPGLRSVSVLTRDGLGRPITARFEGAIGVTMDGYTLEYTWGASEVEWSLLAGNILTEIWGQYVCTDLGDGLTKVDFKLMVEVSLPVVGELKRRTERIVRDAAVRGLKRRVEANGER